MSTINYPDAANEFCFGIEERSFWFNYRNQFIVHTVRQFPPRGVVADIGAGNGYVSLALQRAGFRTIAIEPGAAGARNARSRGLEVICATLETSGLAPGSLDAAGLFDVLEHIEDDAGFLRTVGSFLRPGARLYLTVPAWDALWSSEDELVGHHHRYRLGTLRQRLQSSGFAVDYSTYLFSPLLLPLLLFRTLPSRLGRRHTLDATQTAAELQPKPGLLVKSVTKVLDAELALVKRRRRIPIGTSCLVSAHKI